MGSLVQKRLRINTMRITVRRSDIGDTLNLQVSQSDTIGELKAKIAEVWQDALERQQRLVFAGKVLVYDDCTLKTYGISRESGIVMTNPISTCQRNYTSEEP